MKINNYGDFLEICGDTDANGNAISDNIFVISRGECSDVESHYKNKKLQDGFWVSHPEEADKDFLDQIELLLKFIK